MARVREYDPEEALEKVMHHFWMHGYKSSSISELVEASGVQRYGLYNDFGGKRGLFLESLDLYRSNVITEMTAPISRPDANWSSIEQFFGKIIEYSEGEESAIGCLMCNSGLEFGESDSDVSKRFGEYESYLGKCFRNALKQSESEITGSLDLNEVSDYLVGMTIAAFVLLKEPGTRKRVRGLIEFSLKSIMRN